MQRITINLDDELKIALKQLALRDFREPHLEALLLIVEGLKRRGFLSDKDAQGIIHSTEGNNLMELANEH